MTVESQGSGATCVKEYSLSAILAIVYVGSIYVWKQSNQKSTHPSVVKRRFLSVSIATIVSVICVYYSIDANLIKEHSGWAILGFRSNGILNAVIYPIILTVILFSGPLVIDFLNTDAVEFKATIAHQLLTRVKDVDIIWIRNYIFAPITEEVVFRACMLALIINCAEPLRAVLLCPLFFGAAHIHHMLEQIRFGVKWQHALIVSSFQFFYTTIFGSYSAYIFLRTGHVIAPIAVHALCNAMGFPNFGSVQLMSVKRQVICITTVFGGLICWMLLLDTLSHPSLFDNTLPWSSQI